MSEVQQKIHEKGFNMGQLSPTDYSSIKVGRKVLEDAVLNLGSLKTIERSLGDKRTVLQALGRRDILKLREISRYFYATNGIYHRVCDYAAYMYRYDWYLEPEIYVDDTKIKPEKVNADFAKILNYLDKSHIKKKCGEIAQKIIVDGAYYAYVIPSKDKLVLQELPINYCRSRYYVGDLPAIEFNMKFFDETFRDINYRLRVLKLFPKEFQKGYLLYKQGKLLPDFPGDTSGSWYLLDPGATIKFSLSSGVGGDIPLFVNSIPAIIDLDAAQDLDRRKQMQQLLKILIQKLPMDKNGDLIFDIDEARDIHNNAVEMLSRAVGIDVLTTFADVSVEDMADKNTATTKDDLQKVERTVFNSLGISQNLFNTDGNLSLEKSILNDEATLRQIILQFEIFFNRLTEELNPNKKKYSFKLRMLETTQYNYKEVSKMYKEQVQLGYSKLLPQVALGHSQSSILNTIYFENEILKLGELMIPPMSSNVMNAESAATLEQHRDSHKNGNATKAATGEEKQAGRPEKADDQKSTKTIQNRESMS